MIIFIICVVILIGLFNPWTGLFGDTFYSPKNTSKKEEEIPEKHRSFKLTK